MLQGLLKVKKLCQHAPVPSELSGRAYQSLSIVKREVGHIKSFHHSAIVGTEAIFGSGIGNLARLPLLFFINQDSCMERCSLVPNEALNPRLRMRFPPGRLPSL